MLKLNDFLVFYNQYLHVLGLIFNGWHINWCIFIRFLFYFVIKKNIFYFSDLKDPPNFKMAGVVSRSLGLAVRTVSRRGVHVSAALREKGNDMPDPIDHATGEF